MRTKSQLFVTGNAVWITASWVDYDEDGWPDLLAPALNMKAGFYHNLANGSFAAITNSALVSASLLGSAHAGADYDNDGWLDVCHVGNGPTYLFHN